MLRSPFGAKFFLSALRPVFSKEFQTTAPFKVGGPRVPLMTPERLLLCNFEKADVGVVGGGGMDALGAAGE